MSEPCEKIIAGMRPWLEGRQAKSVRHRTENQKAWDSAVQTVAEYVRRRMDYNEVVALEIQKFLSTYLPK